MEAEMRRLKLELRQTKEMYNLACKEALIAKQKVGPTTTFNSRPKSKDIMFYK